MTDTTTATPRAGLSRRAFLGSTAAAGVLGAVAPSVLAPGAARAAVMDGTTTSASHWGAFTATVEGGRWTAVEAAPYDPHPTPMLEGVLDSVYSPTRIKYPMVRKSFLEGGPGTNTELRGSEEFVRVSWDEALDLVTSELRRVEETHGPAGTYAGSYGWKSTGKLHNCQNLMRRMLNIKGSFVNSSGDYSTGASQIIMPHVVGRLEVYEQQTVWPVVTESTELLVFWGADPMVTNQIGWIIPDHGAYPGMQAYKDTGKPVIFIDPVRNESCEFFDAEWIAPKPQTDLAMMLGIAHTLYDEGLHDEAFLADYTYGFDLFLPYLTGESDGTPKDADWAAGISGVDADTIRDLARRFAANRTMLASGWSMQRQHMGEQRHWMLVTIAAMLGQIGLPGGGFGLSYHYSSGGSPGANGPVLPGITDGGKAVEGAAWLTESGSASIPVARVVDMLENPGATFQFNGQDYTYPDVKMVYWVGGNPFSHHQNRNRMRQAWQKLETVVVQDFQWTATARHADIVLPATTSYERNDIEQFGDYSLKGIVAMKQVVEPVFEARNEYDIFADICERLGDREAFTEGKEEMDWIREFYASAQDQGAAMGIDMPDFDSFWEQGDVRFEVTEEGRSFVRYADFRDDPLLEPLGTPTGLIEIYSRNIEKMGYEFCPPHPTWIEPVERLDGPGAAYPLHVLTSHPRRRLHSQLCGTKLREGYAVAGREPCLIHPDDAAARGISDGDVVRVFNDRGQLLAGAVLSDALRPGVIRVNEGGWYDPVSTEPGALDAYGDVNNLTVDIGTSELAQGNCGHTALADVEKFEGELPPVTVFEAPAGAA
jgi:trimethylamine-N-oxide reductase (cytochrome c)